MIKTPDLCERCIYGECNSKMPFCLLCEMIDEVGMKCKCDTIKTNTPCPYFVEKPETKGLKDLTEGENKRGKDKSHKLVR